MTTASDNPFAAQAELSERVEALSAFDGPPGAFLRELLAAQCRLASGRAGAVLSRGEGGELHVIAAHPGLDADSPTPLWLAQVEQTLARHSELTGPIVQPVPRGDGLYGLAPEQYIIMLPLAQSGGLHGVTAFVVDTADEETLAQRRRELELSQSLLSLYEMRLQLRRRDYRLQSLRGATEVLAAVNQHAHFKPAAMAFCNEIASRYGAERVSLGVLRGRYVKLKAMSHVEKVNRRMKLSQAIEAAMEECLDQDTEIFHPPESPPPEGAPEGKGASSSAASSEGSAFISRSTAALASQYGPTAVLSLPLREKDRVVAVLTIERDPDQPFTREESQWLRLTCELVWPRLLERHRDDRWAGARWADQSRTALGKLVGPHHT